LVLFLGSYGFVEESKNAHADKLACGFQNGEG